MGIFSNLNATDVDKGEDRLGGGGFILETDVYRGTIKMAYAITADSGARGVVLITDFGGKEYRETFYITNKKEETFWTNDQGKKMALPGFTVIDDLAMVTTEKSILKQDSENKIVKVYNYETKKDENTSVPVLVDLIGKPCLMAIYKNLENKSQKDSNGKYVDIADTRDTNSVEKVFHEPTGLTLNEATSGATEAVFIHSWTEKHKGKVKDKRSIKDGQAGTSGRPGSSSDAAPAAGSNQRKSLFGN